MFRRILAVVVMLWLLLMSASLGCSQDDKLAIFTGGESGTYYPLGQALARIIDSEVKDMEASAVSSEGSVSNARAISAEEAGLALIQNDIADYAYKGSQMFSGSPAGNIRGIAAWYPETIQFVVLKESGIMSIGELAGKRVGVGAPGSGTAVEALAILGMAGINKQNSDIQYLDFKEVAAALQNGSIDAGVVTAGLPTPAITELSGAREVYILEIPDGIYDSIKELHPFFVRQSVSAGTYNGLGQDISTLGVMAMLVTRESLPEETVYNITKAIFENLEILVDAHPRAGDINLDTALEGISIPLHPGAERYYRELGVLEAGGWRLVF